jgi:alkylation response protein AidB-like acyl-CoA dehydrogenase
MTIDWETDGVGHVINSSALTDVERKGLLSTIRDFARNEVAPLVRDYDREERLPPALLKRMADLDFFGGVVPIEWGGLGLDYGTYAIMIEEISRVDHILGVLMSMPSALVGAGLLTYGTTAQKEQWLTPLARGEIFGAAGVTEPQSGSDVAGMQTTYTKEGDRYVIRGAKTWISNLDIASFFVTFATSDPKLRHRGVTAFILPADAPGLSVNPFKNKLGFRPICTGELVLDEVVVGSEAVIGAEHEGWPVAMVAVERGRLAVASRAVGMAQSCLDASIAYARDRVVFGKPIGEFQMVQRKIADMATEIKAARLLVADCAREMDRGERARVAASMAKMFASDVAQRAATEAVQIHGAYGVSDDYIVGRAYRDAKVFQIVEGANDIHRQLIAGKMLGLRST